MEDLNSPELKQWIDPKNALAFGYLNALPQQGLRKDGANPAMLTGLAGSVSLKPRSSAPR